MNLTASATAGRAPARRKPTPPSGSRSPAAAPGSPVPARGPAHARCRSRQAAGRGRRHLAAATSATSPASSPASSRSTRSPPTPTGARPGAPAPAASPAHAARAGTSWLSSWLHPLKLRSLQETRGDSLPVALVQRTEVRSGSHVVEGQVRQVKTIVQAHKAAPQADLIQALTPTIRGWSQYYATVASSRTFAAMDRRVFQSL